MFVGYYEAFKQAGVDVKQYALDKRFELAKSWLEAYWRKIGKPPERKPNWFDILYWASRDARDMAEILAVDWVLIVSGMYLSKDAFISMRRAGLKTALLCSESPYEDEAQSRLAALVDVVWTTERSSAERLGAGYVRHAYDPLRHSISLPIDLDVPAHDVVFVGTGFEERIEQLAAVDWTGIDLGLYGNWSLLGSRHKLRTFVRAGPVSNERAVALYRRARIGLNLHRTSCGYGRGVPHIPWADSLNPRAYELAACGVFQISDYRAELREIFPNGAVPTFQSDHLEDVLRAYLLDSPARHYAARRAREAVAPHTFAARAAQLIADLEAFDDRSFAKGA